MKTRLHIMGIGGSGANAFSKLAKAQGYEVSGCDKLLGGHSPSHLDSADILITSPAINSLDPKNPELVEAKRRGIVIFTWQEFLGRYLLDGYRVVGVCGTHGKTTTAAMIAYILEQAGFDPSYLLGAKIKGGENFRLGKSDLFVVEADEFNDNFLNYPVSISVCVSLEFDHPEYFSGFEDYLASFEKFVGKGRGLVCCSRDLGARRLLKRLRQWGGEVQAFDDLYPDALFVCGDHNRINARAAQLAAADVGVSAEDATQYLAAFPGVERRLELKGIVRGARVYSDYGHHPTQLRVVLESLRRSYPKERITVVFQPHMFSRTRALFDDFVKILRKNSANKIILSDIFPSREVDRGEVCSLGLAEAVNRENVCYLPRDQIVGHLKREAGGVIVFIGAGDICELIEDYARD